jgi:hypothetical protein
MMPKGFTVSVKHHSYINRLILCQQTFKHISNAIHCPGRLTLRIGEIRGGMKGSAEVKRTIY